MGLARLLLILGILWALIYFLNIFRKKIDAKKNTLRKSKMVRCEYCNVYVPESDAQLANEKYYCCREHVNAMVEK